MLQETQTLNMIQGFVFSLQTNHRVPCAFHCMSACVSDDGDDNNGNNYGDKNVG